MARTPNTQHAVNAVFYVGGKELSEQLAAFCSLKKLAWSPDVKVAMTKLPATNIEDAAWALLMDRPVSELQGILADLLKPIKEHDLFDLSDWLRDLDKVPLYMQAYWSANRLPSKLDNLLKQAIVKGVSGPGATLDPAWPMPPAVKSFDDEDEPVKPKKLKTAPIPKAKKPLTGPKGRGKVAKEDVKYTKPEPKEFVGAVDSSVDVLVDDAVRALKDKKMVLLSSKAVWTRVHKAVEAMLQVNGMELSTTTRPQRVVTDDPKQALVTYYIKAVSADEVSWHDFKAEFLTAFDGVIAEVQAVNDEEPPKSFKVWYQHA